MGRKQRQSIERSVILMHRKYDEVKRRLRPVAIGSISSPRTAIVAYRQHDGRWREYRTNVSFTRMSVDRIVEYVETEIAIARVMDSAEVSK